MVCFDREENDISETEILNELSKFTGTEQYFKASILYNLNLTDGINYLRNTLNCYWLIDIVGSTQQEEKIKENLSFIVWRIKVNEDKSFIVNAYRDSPFNEENLLYEQKGKFTDFKLNEFEFYQIDNVLLLKSEY
jgi:hypothetical protein